jgi:quercetin dioxygenase-like cupin family protein
MKAYKEVLNNNSRVREFKVNTPNKEFVWHRDEKDRYVTVLEGEGWHFQLDNELPLELQKKDVIFIPKQKYHRVLKGKTDLLIKIEEND